MGFSMPQTKHMREFGCFSMIFSLFLIFPRSSHTESYSKNASVYRNLGWDVQQRADNAAVQLSRKALVFWLWLEAGNAATLVVGIEPQVQADGILDAAHETHARVGLFFHDRSSLCRLHYSIDTGFGQTSAVPSLLGGAFLRQALPGSARAGRTGAELMQKLLGTVLFHGLTLPFDKKGFREHNIVIVRPPQQ